MEEEVGGKAWSHRESCVLEDPQVTSHCQSMAQEDMGCGR